MATDAMTRAYDLYMGLLDALLGPESTFDRPIHLDVLAVLHDLHDVDRWSLEDFIERCTTIHAARKYTIPEVAAILNISPSTIRRELARGSLKGYKRGNRWRFTAEEIEQYVQRSAYVRKD